MTLWWSFQGQFCETLLYSGGDKVFPQGSTVLGNVSYTEENMDTLSINNRNTLLRGAEYYAV